MENKVSDDHMQKTLEMLQEAYKCSGEDSDNNKNIKSLTFASLFSYSDVKTSYIKFLTRLLIQGNEPNTVQIWNRILRYISKPDICTDNVNCVFITINTFFDCYPLAVEAILLHIDEFLSRILKYVSRLIESVKGFYFHSFKEKEILLNAIHSASRLLLSTLQRNKAPLHSFSLELVKKAYDLLQFDGVTRVTKLNFAMILMSASFQLPAEFREQFIPNSAPYWDILDLENSRILKEIGITQFNQTDTTKLCLLAAILHTVSPRMLQDEVIHGIPAPVYLYQEIIKEGLKLKTDPGTTLEISTALVMASKNLNIESYTEPLLQNGLRYVWMHAEHHMDIIKSNAKIILENFINVALQFHDHSLMEVIKNYIKNTIRCCSIRYISIGILGNKAGCEFLLQENMLQIDDLLFALNDAGIAQCVCTTYENLMKNHLREIEDDEWKEIWVEPLMNMLKLSTPATIVYYKKLITSAFKLKPLAFEEMFKFQNLDNLNELSVLLQCVQIARQTSLELSGVDNPDMCWRGLLPFDLLDALKYHYADEIRIAALTLIVQSRKSTETFTEWEFEYLKQFLQFNITTQASSMQKEIVSLYKRAFIRFNNTFNHVDHKKSFHEICDTDKAGNVEASETKSGQKKYLNFLKSIFRDVLSAGLRLQVNYIRKSMSLDILIELEKNCDCIQKEWKELWEVSDILNLTNIIKHDTYEMNKQKALSLLSKIPLEEINPIDCHSWKYSILDCLNLMKSIKPIDSISASYLLELLLSMPASLEGMKVFTNSNLTQDSNNYLLMVEWLMAELQDQYLIAKDNLHAAAINAPMYGTLLCIRHLIEKEHLSQTKTDWSQTISSLIQLCYNIRDTVLPVVNNSSPEGFLPINLLSDQSATSQMLLVLSWRTVKELSLLLGEIALEAPILISGQGLIAKNDLINIGDFFFNLLLTTQHRGAFEQAYCGFCKVCRRFWNSPHLKSVPVDWLTKLNDILFQTEIGDQEICPTRRSAGIPYLIQGILVNEPQVNQQKYLKNTMSVLLKFTKSGHYPERRSHAMNVLRFLFRHNQLGEGVAPFISEGVLDACVGFKSEIWGVRNSATLLFAALMTRIFGVQRTKEFAELSMKNKMMSHVFRTKFPLLHCFVRDELAESTAHKHYYSLHPVLLIVGRLYIANQESSDDFDQCLQHINVCLSDKVHRTRELAALAAVSIIREQSKKTFIYNILQELNNIKCPNNRCQGLITMLHNLVKTTKVVNDLVPEALEAAFAGTVWILLGTGKYTSHWTAILYMEMFISFSLKFLNVFKDSTLVHDIFLIVRMLLKEFTLTGKSQEKIQLHLYMTKLHILGNLVDCKYWRKLTFESVLMKLLGLESNELKRFSLNVMIYCSSAKNLHVIEELENLEKEYKFLAYLNDDLKELVYKIIQSTRKEHLLKMLNNLPTNSDLLVSVFLALANYSHVIDKVAATKQEILNLFLKWSRSENENVTTAVIYCISEFLSKLNVSEGRSLKLKNLIPIIEYSSSPLASLNQRLAVCDLLLKNKKYYCGNTKVFFGFEVAKIWNVIIILVEDIEQVVREKISELVNDETVVPLEPATQNYKINAAYAQHLLIENCYKHIPTRYCIQLCLGWIFRAKIEVESDDSSEVFDQGAVNNYAENLSVAKLASRVLRIILWHTEFFMEHRRRTKFIEEHVLVIASRLQCALCKPEIVKIPTITNKSASWALSILLEYLETNDFGEPNFNKNFRERIDAAIKDDQVTICGDDAFKIEMMLEEIFSPVFEKLEEHK